MWLNLIPKLPRWLASNDSWKNVAKDGGLQPRKKKLVLFVPNSKLTIDFISIVIFDWSILLWNFRISDVAFKMMTMNSRFNLLNPKKIILRIKLLRNGMRKVLRRSIRSTRRQSCCGGGEEGGETIVRINAEAMNRSLGFNLSSEYHKRVDRTWERRGDWDWETNILQPNCHWLQRWIYSWITAN